MSSQDDIDAAYAAQRHLDVDAARALLFMAQVTLRQWAADARGTTVTSGNAVATLQVVVTRLGVFFDRFADLMTAVDLDGK